ncbi:MAG: type II toxin-antitoxin system VapC family toxin [Rhodanobacteraceae bacterium]
MGNRHQARAPAGIHAGIRRDAARYFRAAGYRLLGVSAEHAVALETLPPLHHDPFDRILVAQALVEPLRLVTDDQRVATYGNTIIAV